MRSYASGRSNRGGRGSACDRRARPPHRAARVIDQIRTRVTEILGIRYPILQAGMIWASGYKLAVACAEADILGTIGSAGMKQDLLRSQIQKARALTKKRIAVNIPLLRGDAAELLEIAIGEGISVGTRFACTIESSSHTLYKEAVVAANDAATTLFAKRIAPVRAIKNRWVEEVRKAEAAGATREELEQVYGRSHSRRGILEGNVEEGELEAGQSSGLIRDIIPAAEVVKRFVEEFEQNLNRLRRIQS